MFNLLAGIILAVLLGPVHAESIRFATFNASMSRGSEGALAIALQEGDDPQIARVAGIIRAVDPDVLLINEFDHGAGRDRTFVANYLRDAYPFSFIAPSNTGVATGFDLDGNGVAGSEPGTMDLARDSHGFGRFEGQYGMVVLSKREIVRDEVRTFRTFLWKDMPGARLPIKPDGTPFYSDEALEVLRLSSKSHWDVPVRIDGVVVHFLVCHPHSARLRRAGGSATAPATRTRSGSGRTTSPGPGTFVTTRVRRGDCRTTRDSSSPAT